MTKKTVTVSQELKSGGCPPEEEVVGGTVRRYEVQCQRISGRRKGEWLGAEARKTPVPHRILCVGPICPGIGRKNKHHMRGSQGKARFAI